MLFKNVHHTANQVNTKYGPIISDINFIDWGCCVRVGLQQYQQDSTELNKCLLYVWISDDMSHYE